jgi:signal transduction histidine kinase
VKQLNSVLDDFLFLEKTENQMIRYNYSNFMFSNFLNEIIINTKPILKKGQTIVYHANNEDIEVFFDKNILEIIFRNILYNAIKYSPERSIIEVEFLVNSYLKIRIKDQGIGIPKNDQRHVFERFFRARNAVHFQGTGIGLNIVKHHIEKFGGTIQFKSKENRGTTFTVKLPWKTHLN